MTESSQIERLEIYKLYVDSCHKVTDTRLKANVFFISLNTIILNINNIYMPILGILINVLWMNYIKYCKYLNEAKFKIVGKIESNLCHQCFQDEYKIYKNEKIIKATTIEQIVAICIIGMYCLILLQHIIEKICALCVG